MKTFQNVYNEKFYKSNIFDFYFEELKIGILDIETTGLSPDKCKIILGGLSYPSFDGNPKLNTIQYFAENLTQEASLLSAYKSTMEKFDVLISYNGNRFDIPFIQKRLSANNLPTLNLAPCQSFDVYRALQCHSVLRKILPNLKQKTLENYMGLWANREDEITGKESVSLYYDYLNSNDLSKEKLILLHNEDDLHQLARLLSVLAKVDLHEIMFYNGFTVVFHEKYAYIHELKLRGNNVAVKGSFKNVHMNYKGFEMDYEVEYSTLSNLFNLKVILNDLQSPYSYFEINKKVKTILKKILSNL